MSRKGFHNAVVGECDRPCVYHTSGCRLATVDGVVGCATLYGRNDHQLLLIVELECGSGDGVLSAAIDVDAHGGVGKTLLACVGLDAAILLRFEGSGVNIALSAGLGEVERITDHGIGSRARDFDLAILKGIHRNASYIARNPVAADGGVLHAIFISYRLDKKVAAYENWLRVYGTCFRGVALVEGVMDCRALCLAENHHVLLVEHAEAGPRHHILTDRAVGIGYTRFTGTIGIVFVSVIGCKRYITIGHQIREVLRLRNHFSFVVSPVDESEIRTRVGTNIRS